MKTLIPILILFTSCTQSVYKSLVYNPDKPSKKYALNEADLNNIRIDGTIYFNDTLNLYRASNEEIKIQFIDYKYTNIQRGSIVDLYIDDNNFKILTKELTFKFED